MLPSIKKTLVLTALAGFLSIGATVSARADTVICANPALSTQDRQYQTTGASDCVWGTGNIGQGNSNNDEFLNGSGTNDAAYGNSGATFGLTWSLIDKQNAATGGIQGSLSGLTVTNSDNNTFDWLLTDSTFAQYALGLTDGGDPKWAVFLLSSLSGVADILTSGSWSHIALYGTGTPNGNGNGNGGGGGNGNGNGNNVPEPSSLALLGIGLLGFAAIRQRRQRT